MTDRTLVKEASQPEDINKRLADLNAQQSGTAPNAGADDFAVGAMMAPVAALGAAAAAVSFVTSFTSSI